MTMSAQLRRRRPVGRGAPPGTGSACPAFKFHLPGYVYKSNLATGERGYFRDGGPRECDRIADARAVMARQVSYSGVMAELARAGVPNAVFRFRETDVPARPADHREPPPPGLTELRR